MSNTPTIFTFQNHQVRNIVDEQGSPWFVVADICSVLEIQNPTDAIKTLDDDEKARRNLGLPGGETNLISESGLYTLIIRSNKPQSKKFRKWVTSEVLPAIRKTGTYSVQDKNGDTMAETQLAEVAFRVRQAMSMVKSFGFSGDQGRLMANEAVKKATGIDALDMLGARDLVIEGRQREQAPVATDNRLPTLHDRQARMGSSMLADFIDDCCVLQEGSTAGSTVLYNRFCAWFTANRSGKTPAHRVFGDLMSRHFHKESPKGSVIYCGLALRADQEVSHV